MKLSLIASVFAAVQVTALQLKTSCEVREKTIMAIREQYSHTTIAKYVEQEKAVAPKAIRDHTPIQFDLACSEQNICSMWTDTIFEEYICCLEKDPDTIDTLAKCEIFFKDCCDPEESCCPLDTYQTNANCRCDPLKECCNLWGDDDEYEAYFPFNMNCECNPDLFCCDGEACCNSEIECCHGDSWPKNIHCPNPCDRKFKCCPGDSWQNNSNCECDSALFCCKGETR